jgi:hypothetical protein
LAEAWRSLAQLFARTVLWTATRIPISTVLAFTSAENRAWTTQTTETLSPMNDLSGPPLLFHEPKGNSEPRRADRLRVPMGRHPRLHHSTTAPLTRSIRDRGCTHGPRHDTGHAVPESNPKSRVGRRRAVARRADNQARAMATIAVGEREEWTAPQRVKPVHSAVLHVLSGWSCTKARTARAARDGNARSDLLSEAPERLP